MASAGAMALSLEYQKEHIDDTRVPMIMASIIAWFVITYVVVVMRLVSRRLSRTPLKWDDWCILSSLIFTTVYFVLIQQLVVQGFGKHVILVKSLRLFMLVGLASEVTYCVALPIIKFSTLLLLHRIFPDKAFARTSWAIAAVILLYSITQIICLVVQCIPLSFLWNPTIPVHCINLSPILIVCSSLNIVTDLAIFYLPIPRLWALRISIKHRIQLISMFLLGALVCIISIVRLPKLLDFSFFDASWKDVDFAVWSGYELAFATVSACVPTLRPLLDCVCGRRQKSVRSGGGSTSMLYGPQTYISATYVPTPLRYPSQDDVRTKSLSMTQSSRPDSRLSFAVQEFDAVQMQPVPPARSGIRVKTELAFDFQEVRRAGEWDY